MLLKSAIAESEQFRVPSYELVEFKMQESSIAISS
jgi:hypothetical protein